MCLSWMTIRKETLDGAGKSSWNLYSYSFCVRKCLYCDFLSAPVGEADREAYCEMLCKEIAEKGKESAKYSVDTIFLGGGTPSLLSGKQDRKIMDAVFLNFRVEKDAEISMEANPGTLSQETLSDYLGAGVNRLSIGLQSAHNEELRALGRIHSYEDFLESYEMAAQLGFSNLNVDLMLGIPGQTLQSYLETLRMVTHLPCKPAHISAYSLIVEEGTPFSRHVEQLPDEDTERYMYHLGTEYLKGRGYEQYEISNYARKGFESRHNCKYWKRENYLGLGLGASSMIENVRFKIHRCSGIIWQVILNGKGTGLVFAGTNGGIYVSGTPHAGWR